MKKIVSCACLAALVLFGCSTPTPQPQPPQPPPTSWTNAARLPDGQMSKGIAIYFKATPPADVIAKLTAIGAVMQSSTVGPVTQRPTAWTINPVDRTNTNQRDALTAAAEAGATFGPYP